MVNGRGRGDTCSIIRPDKGGQAEGGKVGGWEDDGAFSMSLLFIRPRFYLGLEINIIILKRIFCRIERYQKMKTMRFFVRSRTINK